MSSSLSTLTFSRIEDMTKAELLRCLWQAVTEQKTRTPEDMDQALRARISFIEMRLIEMDVDTERARKEAFAPLPLR